MKALKPIGGAIWLTAKRVAMDVAACIERCCGGGGGGGERYKIYLQKYCTRPECKNFVYFWSDEIAYGNLKWSEVSVCARTLPNGQIIGVMWKIGGVCYWCGDGRLNDGVCQCEEWGPSCCDQIPHGGYVDGPPTDFPGDWDAVCGPCCGQFGDQDLCRTGSFWSCSERRFKCYERGEADDVYISATKLRKLTLSAEYIAYQDRINAPDPNYRSCWNGGLALHERESFTIRYENRLVPDSEGCLSLIPTCRQAQYNYYQGYWVWWNFGGPPSCEWITNNGGGEYCEDVWRFTFWPNANNNTTDIDPFTGGVAGQGGFQCSFNDSGCNDSGHNCWTRQYASYSDGLIRSITDRTITRFDTIDENNNVIPYGIFTEEFTYIRVLTVTVPCDGDTNRGCGTRAVCADQNRQPPPEKLPKLKQNTPPSFPLKLPKLTGRAPRNFNQPLLPPRSTGEML